MVSVSQSVCRKQNNQKSVDRLRPSRYQHQQEHQHRAQSTHTSTKANTTHNTSTQTPNAGLTQQHPNEPKTTTKKPINKNLCKKKKVISSKGQKKKEEINTKAISPPLFAANPETNNTPIRPLLVRFTPPPALPARRRTRTADKNPPSKI